MKKLLLTSDGFTNSSIWNKFVELIGKPADKIKVLYVPTAVNVEEDKSYAEESKKELIKLGITKKNLIEFDLDKDPDWSLLKGVDSLFIEGGNTFYLLSRVRQTGFDKKIVEMVNSGIVYVGVSAGTIIAGKNIEIAHPFDKNDYIKKDFRGLKLTNRIITPHFQSKETQIIKNFEERMGYEVTRLNDGQALYVVGELERVLK